MFRSVPWFSGLSAVAALAALAAPRTALADDQIAHGTIVKIEAQEVYISLGSSSGVVDGAQLRIKRVVTLHHPVTRAPVTDWIPIGSARVTQAGGSLSRAVLGDLVSAVKVGDLAEVFVEGARPAPPPPAPVRTGAPVDPATAEVLAAFAAQAGQSLDARIAAWERFLSSHTGSPFADVIRRDLGALHTLREELTSPPVPGERPPVVAPVLHDAPHAAAAGAPIAVVFVMDQPERVASAYLHYRPHGAPTYKRVLLARDHERYLRGAVPADAVAPPGVDYFVEVSAPDGATGLALASPSDPVVVAVDAPAVGELFAAVPGRSKVHLAADYLSFSNLDSRAGDHRDHVVHATVDFTYKLPGFVESLGVGYGVYAGAGGAANAVWTPDNPLPSAGFHYGYADAEVGGTTSGVHVAVGGQLIAGVGKTGFGLGAEGRVRIGDPRGTNLAFIARTVEEVGFLSDIRFGTQPVRGLLLGVSVGATNQPNDQDIGVRLGTELEVIAIQNLGIFVRGSWQGRSVDHDGVGGGAGVEVSW